MSCCFICPLSSSLVFSIFFFNDTAPSEIYTLSLHDALPICTTLLGIAIVMLNCDWRITAAALSVAVPLIILVRQSQFRDRKSTRLNSSHMSISYAVFCLKKKKKKIKRPKKETKVAYTPILDQ